MKNSSLMLFTVYCIISVFYMLTVEGTDFEKSVVRLIGIGFTMLYIAIKEIKE